MVAMEENRKKLITKRSPKFILKVLVETTTFQDLSNINA